MKIQATDSVLCSLLSIFLSINSCSLQSWALGFTVVYYHRGSVEFIDMFKLWVNTRRASLMEKEIADENDGAGV